MAQSADSKESRGGVDQSCFTPYNWGEFQLSSSEVARRVGHAGGGEAGMAQPAGIAQPAGGA
jgi:hypothetical protein